MDDQRPIMADRRPLLNDNLAEEDEEHICNGTPQINTAEDTTGCCFVPCRYVLVFIMMAGFFTAFAQRMVFNMALVAMVNFTEPVDINATSNDCPATPLPPNTTSAQQEGEFNWDPNLQSLLLGAFFYGYPISQLPFGYLAERYGGKAIFAFNGLTTGILSLLIPTVARWNPYALIVLRAVQGFCQGSIYPTCLAMMSRWGPPGEQTRMYSIVNSGATLGSVIAMAVSGVMCQSTFLGGWPSTFYLFGGLSVLWTVAWLFLAYDTPAVHPRITQAEKDYIIQETEGLASVKYANPPWCSIIKSVPVWAIFIVICTDNFGFYVTFSCMPIYMKEVLRFDMSQDGLVSALPYLVQFPITIGVGLLADFIRRRRFFRVVNIRRGAAIIGELGPGVFLLLVGFVGCNKMATVSLLMLSVGANSFMLAGPAVSFFDIAPLYAGSLMGVLNGMANICGIIAPIFVAKITNNSGDQTKWRTVFCISAAIYAFGALVYCLFLSDKEQKWAKDKRKTEEQKDNDTSAIIPSNIST